MQRAVLDGDFLHHVGLALADVFVELLLVLVEEVLALERADDLPIFRGPGLLDLHEDLAGEADELVGREGWVDGADLVGHHVGVVQGGLGVSLSVDIPINIVGVRRHVFLFSPADEDDGYDKDEHDEARGGVLDEEADEVADEGADVAIAVKATVARSVAVVVAHVGNGEVAAHHRQEHKDKGKVLL